MLEAVEKQDKTKETEQTHRFKNTLAETYLTFL